jgi:Uma2 family endonuclease
MATQTNPITVEQYEHSFEGYPGLRDELINGRIVMTPDAKPLNQHIQRNIQRALEAACEDTEYTVNGDSNINFRELNSAPSPDVFVVATARWSEAMKAGTYLDVPPLLAVEILSPGQDISEKIEVYLKAGVSVLWVVDPNNKTVLYYAGYRKHLYQLSDEIYLPMLLNGSIKVANIFAGTPNRQD